MHGFVEPFLKQLFLSSPLFLLVLLGYCLVRWAKWPKTMSESLTRFVFSLALPAMLFRMMSDFSNLPPVDARLLIAFFGSCLIVFIIGRISARWIFRLDGSSASIFALGGIFSNLVMLGLPIARITLGEKAIPSIALIIVFNSLTLWTLVSVSIEFARNGSLTAKGFLKTARNVATNPIVASIITGTVFGLSGLPIPSVIDAPLSLLGQTAVPMSLMVLGMGLAEYPVGKGWRQSLTMCSLKLAIQPLIIWMLARMLALPPLETQAAVLVGSMATGANVYLMARHFQVMEGPAASSLVLSTILSAFTTPLVLVLIGADISGGSGLI